MWLFLAGLLVLALQLFKHSMRNPLASVERWFILLSHDAKLFPVSAEQLAHWDMAVLDADAHLPLSSFEKHTRKIGYVSLGEAEAYRTYWSRIQNAPWRLEENPHWKGNYFVDVRSPEWQKVLLQEVIPAILNQGFDGLELDTLDNAGYLEGLDPIRFQGMKQAMIELVREIRKKFPEAILLGNGGFDIMDSIAAELNGVLVEDIFWGPDFKRGGYRPAIASEQIEKIHILKKAMREHGLIVFNIEYLPRTENEEKKKIRLASRRLEFRPYFAEKDLTEIYPQIS